MRTILKILAFLLLTGNKSHLLAAPDSYTAGFNYYSQGNYDHAEQAFKTAFERQKSPVERARVSKMLGICQFMLGKRSAAETSFQLAKKLQPNIQISRSEVPDESILSFFQAVQGPEPTPAAKPREPEISAAKELLPQNSTLIIEANATNYSLSINGQKIETTSNSVQLRPGKYLLQIDAAGYISQAKLVTLETERPNHIHFELLLNKTTAEEEKLETKSLPPSLIKPKKKLLPPPPPVVTRVKKERLVEKKIVTTKPKEKEPIQSETINTTRNKLWLLTPLGIPQMSQEKYVPGALFLAAQAGGLYTYWFNSQAADHLLKKTNNRRNALQDEINALPEGEKRDAKVIELEEFNKTVDDTNNQLAAYARMSTIGVVFFGLFYAASSTEAILNPPEGYEYRPLFTIDEGYPMIGIAITSRF